MAQDIESSSLELINVTCTPRNRANLRRLKTNSIQSFQRWEKENELLYAMIEDESTWLSTLFPDAFITAELFFYALEDGTILCLLANYIQDIAEKYSQKTDELVPGKKFTFHQSKKGIRESKLFHSRDNVEKFLSWCRLHGIPEAILFESNDVVLVDECRTGGREIVICLMEIARRCVGYEMHTLPQLIKLEREIDEEELNDIGHSSDVGEPLEFNSRDSRGDRSPIDSDSGVESVFEEGVETSLQLIESTDGDYKSMQDNKANNTKQPQQNTKQQKAPSSLLESAQPKTELDEKVCKIAQDYNIKIVHRLKEGKYIILGKTMFVRMLNDYLLVRIGGGWDTLEHYIMTHSSKPTPGDNSNPITPPSEPRSRKGSSVWSKLVEKVKKRDSQPIIPVSPVVISKTPRPDSSPASYSLRNRFKKRLSVEEKDGKDISDAIQKIESSFLQTPNSSHSSSFTTKTFFQLKSRFRGSKNSLENLSERTTKTMEEVNTGLNGDIKEKEGQEGGRNVQDGANDLLMVENGDTATAATTLIDFQDSTFASSSHNPPPGNDLQPKTTADDLLFGDGQPSEQTHVYSTLQSSEISSDEPSEILLPSTVVQTEQSEVNRQSESEIMTFSTHKEEKCFEEVWTGEVLEGSLAMGGTETDPHPRDQAGLAEYQLTVMMEQVETQPEEAHMPDIPIDNIEEQTTNQADLDESQPPETAMSNDEPECRANMEVQPEVQEKSQTVLELARDDVETVYHTNDQFTDQFESQPVVQEETHDTGKDNIENVDKQQQSVEQVEPQPAGPEEAKIPETRMDNVQSVYKLDEHSTELVESGPPALNQPDDASIGNVEDVCRADEQFTEEVESIYKPDDHSTELFESEPPAAIDQPQTEDASIDNVEDVYRTDEQFTEEVESQPPALDPPQTEDASIDNVEDVYRTDEQFTKEVESQPPALDQPQTEDASIDNVEDVYRTDEQFTKEVESQPPALDQPQTEDASIDNVEDVYRTDEQFTKEVESQPPALDQPQTEDASIDNVEDVYRTDEQFTEEVESQPPALDQPQTEDASIDNVEDVYGIDEQFTKEVESQPPALDQPQTEDASIDNVEDVYRTDEQFTKEVESQPPALDQPQTEDASIDNVEVVCRTDEQFTKEVQSQPPALDQPQTEDASIDNVEVVCRTDKQFTEEVQSQPPALDQPQTEDASIDNVEVVCRTDEQFTKEVESQLPALDQPQTEDASIDNVEDVYRTDEQFTKEVESQPPALDQPQTEDASIDNVEDVCRTDKQFTEEVESEYKPDDHSTELVESQLPALDQPQTEDASIDNVEDVYRTDEQFTEPVKHESAAQEELETPEMPLVSVGDSGVPEEKFTENIELKPAVPEANRFTETIKPNEPEQETVESSVFTEVDKDPSKTTPQAAAVKVSTDFKPVKTDSQSSVPKHDKAATQTKTSKTTSAAMKRTKPQSSLAARPQSSKTSKVKTSATSSQTSVTTKKPSGAKSRQVSTAPSKAAPAKPQGSSKPFSTSTKQHVAAKKSGVETSTKSATTSNAPFARPTATSTRPAMSSKTAATSSKSATTRSKPATTSSKPATTSSKPATTSSKPTTTSSKHTTTSSKPATTDSRPASSARPGVTKDKKSTKPPSAPNANTKTTLSKTRPQSGKPTSAKPADKTDGKVPNSLRKVNGKSASSGSSKTAVKQTTAVATSTQGPKTTKTTRNVTTTTVKETKTSILHQSKAGGALKPGSATGAKPKASGASARPKSPTKQSSKKTTTTKTEKPVAAAEPPCNAADNSASQEVTTESDVTTTVLERTFTEDGDETTMREVTETVSTNAEQEAIVAETVVDKSE